MYYADSQAFLALQGQPPIFDPEKRPQLSLALVTSVPPFAKDFHAALAAHDTFRGQALSNLDTYEVRVKDDIVGGPGMGLLFGLQHAPERMTYERVRTFAREGVRAMTLAFDEATEYGGGFLAEDGLTNRGRQLIEWMNECGIILDLSHSNHETAREALDFIRRSNLSMRPMASHTGCYEIFQHPRNLPDDVLKSIAELDGYVGINLVTFLLCHEHKSESVHSYLYAFVCHLHHASRVMGPGPERVGVGSDCPHIDQTMGDAKGNFARMQKMLQTKGRFGEYFPDRPLEIIEHGGRMLSALKKGMLKSEPLFFLKHGDEYMCGKNFRAFLKRSLPQA